MLAGSAGNLVVDASVAAKWHLVGEEHADKALRLLNRLTAGQIDLWAPSVIRYEVASAITSATLGRSARLQGDLARLAIRRFLDLPLRLVADDDLIIGAFDLVGLHGCALYDALYVALAERMGVPFITADRRLYQRIAQLPYVLWIGDYSAAQSG